MENKGLDELLQKNIEASNRTTHAVRALVLFLFIQLTGITIALVLNSIATANYDPVRCASSGSNCEPMVWLQVVAFLVWVCAVIWSSSVGWTEIGLSRPVVRKIVLYEDRPLSRKSADSDDSTSETCPKCGSEKWTSRSCFQCGQ
jgi:hypothetical protein